MHSLGCGSEIAIDASSIIRFTTLLQRGVSELLVGVKAIIEASDDVHARPTLACKPALRALSFFGGPATDCCMRVRATLARGDDR